ncbi:pro-sigmaK processing inhibitor BofA family protein [Peptoniphilaceae bacterium SGI.131]
MTIIFGILGVFVLFLLLKLLALSTAIILKLVVNGILGLVLLYVFNFVGGAFGLTLEINTINALVAGFFGVPGIVVLLLLK